MKETGSDFVHANLEDSGRCLNLLKSMMITPSIVQPSEAEKQCGRPLVLSKLPFYVLRILNWIPWKTDSTILIFFTVMFHIPGMTVNIVSVRAISQDYFWPGKYTPELLRYALITSI